MKHIIYLIVNFFIRLRNQQDQLDPNPIPSGLPPSYCKQAILRASIFTASFLGSWHNKPIVSCWPVPGHRWASVALVFVVCPIKLALVATCLQPFSQLSLLYQWWSLSMRENTPTGCSAKPVSAQETEVMKANKWLKSRGHTEKDCHIFPFKYTSQLGHLELDILKQSSVLSDSRAEMLIFAALS